MAKIIATKVGDRFDPEKCCRVAAASAGSTGGGSDNSAVNYHQKANTSQRRRGLKNLQIPKIGHSPLVPSIGSHVSQGVRHYGNDTIDRGCNLGAVNQATKALFLELLATTLLIGFALICALHVGVLEIEVLTLKLVKSLNERLADGEHIVTTGTHWKKGRSLHPESSESSIDSYQDLPENQVFIYNPQTSTSRVSSVAPVQLKSLKMSDNESTPWSLERTLNFRMPMPPPGSAGTPFFEGANATEFLERFNELCKDYLIQEGNKLTKLPRYCSLEVADVIKALKPFKEKNYEALQKAILVRYEEYDSHQQTYSLRFLESFKSVTCTKQDDILQYIERFDAVAQVLFTQGILAKYTAGTWFLHGLPLATCAKAVRKLEIDTRDATTVDYEKIKDHVEKASLSNKAINCIQNEKKAGTSHRDPELKDLVDRHLAAAAIPKEKRLQEPVVPVVTVANPTLNASAKMEAAIDGITKSIERLSLGMATLVPGIPPNYNEGRDLQQSAGQAYGGFGLGFGQR